MLDLFRTLDVNIMMPIVGRILFIISICRRNSLRIFRQLAGNHCHNNRNSLFSRANQSEKSIYCNIILISHLVFTCFFLLVMQQIQIY